MNAKIKGYLLGAIAAATYGTNPLFALPLYKEGMDPDSVLFFRYLFAIPIVGFMIKSRGRSFKVQKKEIIPIIVMGLLMTGFFILMISVSSPVVIFLSLLGVGFSMSGIYPTTLSSMDTRYNSSTMATGTCIGTATIGAIVMPLIIGHVAESAGLAGGIATISIALFMMVALMVLKLARSARGLI